MQYFIGLAGYRYEAPFAPSLLVEFRKRLTEEILGEINEMIIQFNAEDEDDEDDKNGGRQDAGSNEKDISESQDVHTDRMRGETI